MDDYSFFHCDRSNRKGGGVALLVHNYFNVKVRTDIILSNDYCESLFIEILIPNKKNIIVGIIYRDPILLLMILMKILINVFIISLLKINMFI